jgi:hypothetical protein
MTKIASLFKEAIFTFSNVIRKKYTLIYVS